MAGPVVSEPNKVQVLIVARAYKSYMLASFIVTFSSMMYSGSIYGSLFLPFIFTIRVVLARAPG